MISNFPGGALTLVEAVEHKFLSASDYRYQPDPFDEARRVLERKKAEPSLTEDDSARED